MIVPISPVPFSAPGYVSGQEAVAHFGLGDLSACDVEIILPHGHGKIARTGVAVDQRIDLGPGGGLQQRLKKVSGTVS